MKKFKRIMQQLLLFLVAVFLLGFLLPHSVYSPVLKSAIAKIDPESFWYYPWGESGVHKGIDIFADSGVNVLAPVYGVIVKKGYGTIAGKYLYLLGPKWRLYYFAHLDTVLVDKYKIVYQGEILGRVGNTGNARKRPPHLHYSIESLFPYFWNYDKTEIEPWKKTFYLNPNEYLGF